MTVISVPQTYQYALRAGFTPANAVIITAIAGAESGYDTDAMNDNGSSKDWGLTQINDKAHPDLFAKYPNLKTDPMQNMQAAYEVAGGNNFKPWVTFWSKDSSGQPLFAKYLPGAQVASGTVTNVSITAPVSFVINGVTITDGAWKPFLNSDGTLKGIGKTTQMYGRTVVAPDFKKLADGSEISVQASDDLSHYSEATHTGKDGKKISHLLLDNSKVVGYLQDGVLTGSPSDQGGAVEQGLPQLLGGALDGLFPGGLASALWIGGGAILVILGVIMIAKDQM